MSLATLNRRKESMRALHALGANVNAPCRSGMTPFMFAAKAGQLELVKVR
jgi:ankyrin repeat protein